MCISALMGDSPIASSSDGSAAPPSSLQLANSETGEIKQLEPEYPRRPGERDCSYYVKFGSCGYGMNCWFNHPPKPSGCGQIKQLEPEYPLRPGEPDCSYYVKSGSCGYGMKCRFNHPLYRLMANGTGSVGEGRNSSSGSEASSWECKQKQYLLGKACNNNHHGGKPKVEQVKVNSLGLPLRPGTGLCTYYMHRGICKFGTNCKFHHPDPESEHANRTASWQASQGSSQLNFSSELVQRALDGQSVPLVTSLTSGTSDPCPEWSGYQADFCGNPLQHGNSRFQTAKRVQYTRDQLLQLHEIVGVSKDILELKQDIEVQQARNDSNVQAQSCDRNYEIDNLDWRSPSAQIPEVASEEKSWDKIREAKEFYVPSGKQEQFNMHDQLSSQLDSNAQMDENKQGKPDWDPFATKLFCDICTDEVLAGNRPTDHLNAIGYNNLCAKFNEKTKKCYNHEQFKSKWESLKKDYQTWKALMESEDGLRQDHKMNTISASPEWWAKKKEAMPDCGKFRFAPLKNVDLLNIMFEDMLDSSSTAPEANLAVNTTIESEQDAGDGNDIGMVDKDANEQSKEAMLQKSINKEPNSTNPKSNYVHAELNHLANFDENVNPSNSATSMRIDRVGSNISEIMELVVDAGAEEGSDEHFIATQLFIRPEYREMFLTLKTPRGRLGWLKKMCQVKE